MWIQNKLRNSKRRFNLLRIFNPQRCLVRVIIRSSAIKLKKIHTHTHNSGLWNMFIIFCFILDENQSLINRQKPPKRIKGAISQDWRMQKAFSLSEWKNLKLFLQSFQISRKSVIRRLRLYTKTMCMVRRWKIHRRILHSKKDFSVHHKHYLLIFIGPCYLKALLVFRIN